MRLIALNVIWAMDQSGDKLRMSSKYSPEDDGDTSGKYYLRRCFATTTRCTWFVPS
jgi:hypothetical protein